MVKALYDGRLAVDIAGVKMATPVTTGSGTFGFGLEFLDLEKVGAVTVKGTSLEPAAGNKGQRAVETPSGMLNCIGLENPGSEYFLEHTLPELKKYNVPVIVNIYGHTPEEYGAVAKKLDVDGVDAVEINISCPNVKEGGIVFGTVPEAAAEVVRAVKANTSKMVIAKLSPNVTDIVVMAKAVLGNVTGGLSGPAVRPVAVRLVYQVAQAVHIPIIGMGGIMCAEDAIEFMLAGASAVAVGTANFVQPDIAETIAHGMLAYLDRHNAQNISEIVGLALPNGKKSMPLFNEAE